MSMNKNKNSSSNEDFASISKDIFQPIYKELARALVGEINPKDICLDIGTGAGQIPFYLQKFTKKKIQIIALDNSDRIQELRNLSDSVLPENLIAVKADAHSLPLKNRTIDFVMSRGSLHFWDKPSIVFDEIDRILKKEGKIMIGGTLGLTERTRKKVLKAMSKDMIKNKPSVNRQKIERALQTSQLKNWEIKEGRQGFWITKNIKINLN